jgi:glycosyltransferase involved in cell wall biosynthesis
MPSTPPIRVKILWLTPELPYAPGGPGGATRQFQILRRLAELGHDCLVVAPVTVRQERAVELLRATGVDLRAVDRPPSRVREVLRASASRPSLVPALVRKPWLAWQVDVFWTALAPIVERALMEGPWDVLHVEHDWAADWGPRVPLDAPRVLTLQNLSWEYYEALARNASQLGRTLLTVEARRFRRFDHNEIGAYDLLATLSNADRVGVQQLSDVRCEVVPVGVDTKALTLGEPDANPAEPVLLFAGHLRWAPNREGLLWLLREVWPKVRDRSAVARLVIVGSDPPTEALSLADARVEFTGYVDDIRPYFERASVILVPILSGSGVRLKLIDGLATGRPVIATPLGAVGFDVLNGEHLLIADSAHAFADAASRLLCDGELRARIGAAGRRLAQERYDWDVIGDRFAVMLESLRA